MTTSKMYLDKILLATDDEIKEFANLMMETIKTNIIDKTILSFAENIGKRKVTSSEIQLMLFYIRNNYFHNSTEKIIDCDLPNILNSNYSINIVKKK